MSSPIFASVSGEVVDIRPMLVPGGAMVKAIVVKNDGKMEEIEGLNEGEGLHNHEQMTKFWQQSKMPALLVWVVQVSLHT